MDIQKRYIFFLKLSTRLDEDFLQISRHYKKFGLELIPINMVDLMEVVQKKKEHVIVLKRTFKEKRNFNIYMRHYLDYALRNGKITLMEFSSFQEVNTSHHYARQRSYFHHQLPISYEELVRVSTLQYYKDKRDNLRWPGGRRSRLSGLFATK